MAIQKATSHLEQSLGGGQVFDVLVKHTECLTNDTWH